MSDELKKLEKNISDLIEIVGYVKEKMVTNDQLAEQLTEIKDTMVTKDELAEQLTEIKDTMVTKDELAEQLTEIKDTMVTKDEFGDFRNEVQIDFSNVHTQLNSLRNQTEDIKTWIKKLEERTKEDSDATAQDFLHLQKRVIFLEQKIKELEKSHRA